MHVAHSAQAKRSSQFAQFTFFNTEPGTKGIFCGKIFLIPEKQNRNISIVIQCLSKCQKLCCILISYDKLNTFCFAFFLQGINNIIPFAVPLKGQVSFSILHCFLRGCNLPIKESMLTFCFKGHCLQKHFLSKSVIGESIFSVQQAALL